MQEEPDLGEFFDFTNASANVQISNRDAEIEDGPHNAESYIHNDHSHDIDMSTLVSEEALAKQYSDFSRWIPRFVKPDEPCAYCRDRKLDCFLSYGKVTCTACDTLFRSCSFVKTSDHAASDEHREESTNMGFLDTLHLVAEDRCQEKGELTGIRPLRSQPVASKKSSSRFPRAAIKVLKDWLDEHPDKPYPTEDEKAQLGRLTGLRIPQINTWLANARRRGKVSKGKAAMDGLPQPTAAIGIPTSANIEINRWSDMNPLERWKHSPPQNEPAPMTAIADALDRRDLPDYHDESSSPSTLGYRGLGSSRDSSHSNRRAPSVTSLEKSTSNSATSSAAWSGSHDSWGSLGSFGSSLSGKRDRRRRRKMPTTLLKKASDDTKARIYQCTFCTDTFKSKYDWTRHEKTMHISLEKYMCCPLGPETLDTATGQRICAYCCAPEPTKDHLETHNHRQCVEKGIDGRIFYRKDHLRQHLRLVHDSKLLAHMDNWRFSMTQVNSRCGFCSQKFSVWAERNDHLAAHFRDGAKMRDWRGCRGLDPAVAALVSTAMPPYLIGQEAISLNPFSASNPMRCMTLQSHLGNGGAPTTCWEILTVRLGRYAKEQQDQGVVLTDEMLQVQARHILYDSDDGWNHTAADNPEWLDLFKRAHALDYIPSEISGVGKNVPEDLEMYGDLGIRIPFSEQLRRGASLDDLPQVAGQPLKDAQCTHHVTQQAQHQGREDEQYPLAEDYSRFSALPIPGERAAAFETICSPWPQAGVLGQTVYTSPSSGTTSVSSQQVQDPDTLADAFQLYNTTAHDVTGDECLDTDIDLLLQEAGYGAPTHSKASDAARQQNAMLAMQHGIVNLTPQQAQHQLAELNAAMAGVASSMPPVSAGVPSAGVSTADGSDLFAEAGDYMAMATDSIQTADLMHMTTDIGYVSATASHDQFGSGFGINNVGTTGAEMAIQDIDVNETNLGDLDFSVGFS